MKLYLLEPLHGSVGFRSVVEATASEVEELKKKYKVTAVDLTVKKTAKTSTDSLPPNHPDRDK